jgi:hypothetical protein
MSRSKTYRGERSEYFFKNAEERSMWPLFWLIFHSMVRLKRPTMNYSVNRE